MGYFSNGTEGDDYFHTYCVKCVHDAHDDCPIWNAHLTHNYAECNNAESILHMLIPRTKDGLDNEQCRLFIAKAADHDLFEGAPE